CSRTSGSSAGSGVRGTGPRRPICAPTSERSARNWVTTRPRRPLSSPSRASATAGWVNRPDRHVASPTMAESSHAPPTSIIKRFFVGRAFTSQQLEHTLLPKVLALPVFASDALSSVAYATGEILIALTLVTSRPQSYVMPIAIAIALLMAIVVSSYRQTVRAYPG